MCTRPIPSKVGSIQDSKSGHREDMLYVMKQHSTCIDNELG